MESIISNNITHDNSRPDNIGNNCSYDREDLSSNSRD